MSLVLAALLVAAIIVSPVLFLVLLDRHTARSDWGEG
jgi:hypothetical protein